MDGLPDFSCRLPDPLHLRQQPGAPSRGGHHALKGGERPIGLYWGPGPRGGPSELPAEAHERGAAPLDVRRGRSANLPRAEDGPHGRRPRRGRVLLAETLVW